MQKLYYFVGFVIWFAHKNANKKPVTYLKQKVDHRLYFYEFLKLNTRTSKRQVCVAFSACPLFPLNSCRGFRGDVVHDAVDALHFVDDAAGNIIQHAERNVCPVGGHTIAAGYGTQRYSMRVGAAIAHNAYGADIGQAGEVLPDSAFQTGFSYLFTEDGVGFAGDLQLFGGNFAEDADSQARAGERLTPNQSRGGCPALRRRHALRL